MVGMMAEITGDLKQEVSAVSASLTALAKQPRKVCREFFHWR
jgi:hypothetical protein